jgi:hypothetical protein
LTHTHRGLGKFLREPLLHCLVLGAGLFVLFDLVADRESDPKEIVVTSARIESLSATFARTWQRPPTALELDGLVQDYVREEVLYRQALELRLDLDDTIIRRRLRQKMEFIAEDVAAQAQPGEDQLAAYLREHAGDYRIDDRYTFRHLYFDPERHGDQVQQAAQRLLAEITTSGRAPTSSDGDPFLLPPEFHDRTEEEIADVLGESFAAALRRLPPAQWHGPIASAYGVHLVRIDQRRLGREPDLAEVRDLVRRDWERQQRLAANEGFFQELLASYTVRIESAGEKMVAKERE